MAQNPPPMRITDRSRTRSTPQQQAAAVGEQAIESHHRRSELVQIALLDRKVQHHHFQPSDRGPELSHDVDDPRRRRIRRSRFILAMERFCDACHALAIPIAPGRISCAAAGSRTTGDRVGISARASLGSFNKCTTHSRPIFATQRGDRRTLPEAWESECTEYLVEHRWRKLLVCPGCGTGRRPWLLNPKHFTYGRCCTSGAARLPLPTSATRSCNAPEQQRRPIRWITNFHEDH